MSRTQPPAGFVTIGEGIYISLNSPAIGAGVPGPQPDESAPNVILIFGWMGALTRHLQSYTKQYAELYPTATQILVKCGASFIWTSELAKRKRLLPVVEALETLGCIPIHNDDSTQDTRPRPRILVHSFSNGGSVQLTTLGRLLHSKYLTRTYTSSVFPSALIVDSSPALSTFRSIHLAISIAIRNPLARYLAISLVSIAHAFRLGMSIIFGHQMMMEYLKAQLLKPTVLPWMNVQTPRLYIYSKKDELVPWQEVKKHAEKAKGLGLNVSCEVYEDSAHVAHMRLDPKRYWASVQAHWQAACRDGPREYR